MVGSTQWVHDAHDPAPTGEPAGTGLYEAGTEHDACGVAFVATLRGRAGHDIVQAGLTALANLEHRGAVGAEVDTGDGAGILTQVPDAFLREVLGVELPPAGSYAVGTVFLPMDASERERLRGEIERIAAQEGLAVLTWRDVPTRPEIVGPSARATMPYLSQVVLADPEGELAALALERRSYRVRKRTERELRTYVASLSCRTLVYKGMLTTAQLAEFFPDLTHESFASELALVHSRFSTNTFPSWPLAQPFRGIAHNGEINTVRGNRNWMAAREGTLHSDELGDLSQLLPVVTPGGSDSQSFDEVLELLHLAGRSLPHAVLMMIPAAWENHESMDPALKAFYAYNATMIEDWDGPACLTFTDGEVIGAVLDRNGLRPGRYWVTQDGLVVLASESGVLDLDPATVVRKGRLEPGRMLLVDTTSGRIVPDREIKGALSSQRPYQEWLDERSVRLEDLPRREHVRHTSSSVRRRQRTFGYTEEELRVLLTPMATTGTEPLGAMGSDTPIAVLSQRPRLLFDYFTQMFAQVTNPPLDAIREELVTSLSGAIGPEPNLLADTPEHARKLVLPFPVLDNDELAKIVRIDRDPALIGLFRSVVVRGTYRVAGGARALAERLEEIFAQVDRAVANGASFLVLSDRESDAENAPIPSLLLLSAVHHHTVRQHTRTRISLVVEAGDVREVHHVALLVGYGAAAVNPYLAMESVEELAREGALPVSPERAVANLIKALGKGVLKVMSKMGISTISAYRGAQVFEAVGLDHALVERYFTGTTSRLGGVGLEVIAAEVAARHHGAYPPSGDQTAPHHLPVGGEYQWRRDGEEHLFDPETVFRLQHATRERRFDVFRSYTARVNDTSRRLMTLRGLLRLVPDREPVPLEEVEPIESIVARFSTGAMSYGSISAEAHETLAVAMNRLGARSNTGEGGEDPARLRDPERRSRVKQIASARFGVTAEYLALADDLQIKLAQGAKPGEGGQLPGHKVYPWIARTRHSTPGVGLISPPPHHDIYSIEDLAQLIHDLKNANPGARVHVKLVSELGVGTVAAGVSKAHADVVLISGHDGGTGASPLTSLKHAGTPWEIGLAETQQTLVLNDLRDRITVQVDGQLRTGRDVVVAALLGAEEFGFATAPMVVSGCVMMRVCHLDTCPVGVATQNPELRARFSGRPEFVETFFTYLATEVRELLASLGFRSIQEAVGQVQVLDANEANRHWKAAGLDLTPVLERPQPKPGSALYRTRAQDHGLEGSLGSRLVELSRDALERREPVRLELPIRNVDRSVGTMLGYEIARRYGDDGLAVDTIVATFTGSAGQSFGAFVPRGLTLRLFGDANDYVAKGLSGGRVVVRAHPEARFDPCGNVIAGNVVGYGATAGEVFLGGLAGERFAVRNSGATFVVEGVGDHALEYMTEGEVLVLGRTGRNFAAGMSGGVAYVLDLDVGQVNQAALTSGELTLSPLEPGDRKRVVELLHRHEQETSSILARRLLSDPSGTLGRVSKIVPTDYARMRAALGQAETAGLDPSSPGAWEEILEVARG